MQLADQTAQGTLRKLVSRNTSAEPAGDENQCQQRQLLGRLRRCWDRVISDLRLRLGAKIVPLEVNLQRPFDIWLSYHPGSNRIPRIRRMIDWIVEAFNSTRFPWFKDEFIHPNDLKAVYKEESLISLFEGFSTEGR
jgi:hypothetical protein